MARVSQTKAAVMFAAVAMLGVEGVIGAADTRLAAAVQARNTAAVRALIQAHADVNAPLPDGATALAWAAHWDDRETAALLIAAGADVNAANELGVTPLMLAATNGSAAMAEKLLNAGADVHAARPSGENAILLAARAGSVQVAKLLVAHGAKANSSMNRGLTPLMLASVEQHPAVVHLLVEVGGDVKSRTEATAPKKRSSAGTPPTRPQLGKLNDREAVNPASLPRDNEGEASRAEGGFTPLLYAALSGDEESADVLLKAGADVNDTAADGSTALVISLTKGHESFARFLLDKGANPDLAAVGYAPLHIATVTSQADAVASLIAHKATVDIPIEKPQRLTETFEVGTKTSPGSGRATQVGATPFMLAAKVGDVRIMKMLADAGANPKATTKDGTTAIMLAAGLAKRGNDDISYYRWTEPNAIAAIGLAIGLGVDVNAQNKWGETALHASAYHAANDVIRFLVGKGANVNVKDWEDQTPMRIADGHLICCTTYVRHAGTAELLRTLGADPSLGARLNFGLTAYDAADKAAAGTR